MRLFTKPVLIGGAAVIVGTVAIGGFFVSQKPQTKYQYVTAETRPLAEQTKSSGQITTAQDVNLSFDRPGRIGRVAVTAGTSVHKGDVLVALDNGIEAGQLAQAEAALNQRLAGATPSEINAAQAVADAANADLNKTKIDTVNAVATAQAALDTAENNLKLANGGENSQIVVQAYENEIATLQVALPTIDDALTQADNILGIDNTFANSDIKDYLGLLAPNTVSIADTLYKQVRTERITVRDQVNALDITNSSHDSIDIAATAVLGNLKDEEQLLGAVSDALRVTLAEGTLTQTALDAKKTTIEKERAALTATYNSVLAQTQTVTNAKNSLETYTIARDKAERDLTAAEADSASAVATKQAMYEQALANAASKTEPPREVDVAALKAAVAAAAANYNKTILTSPIDGTVSHIDATVGASVSPGVPLVSVINESNYQLETRLSEADISTVHLGDQAAITTDAYGNSVVFPATVVGVDSAMSTANEQTGYKVLLQFNQPDSRLSVDMTGNATITTATTTAAVAVPASSVIQKNDHYIVLTGPGTPKEQTVTVGLKGSDGWLEITSGLSVGTPVVVF